MQYNKRYNLLKKPYEFGLRIVLQQLKLFIHHP
jgi:hypothetical protein